MIRSTTMLRVSGMALCLLTFVFNSSGQNNGPSQNIHPSARGQRVESTQPLPAASKQDRISSVRIHPGSAPIVKLQNTVSGGGCELPFTFNNQNQPIPDFDSTGIDNPQLISGLSGTSMGTNVQLKRVCFAINHTYVGDLIVQLSGPGGITVTLMDRPGVPDSLFGCDGDNVDVCVEKGTGSPMEDECNNAPAISGSWTAIDGDDLNAFNLSGANPNGMWTLKVFDVSLGDVGDLVNWSIVFDDGPIALWNAPDTLCQTSGLFNLNSTILGTPGGVWSGQGVSGNNFDPAGLSGNILITYTVTNTLSGCSDFNTYPVYVQPPPVVGFVANTVPNSYSVTFTNTTTGATSYLWDFGDGNSSTDENPVHIYQSSATFTVVLAATNICGTFTSTQNVIVQGCPDVVMDGGFETGQGGGLGPWTEFSTNFGSPICDISCSTGGGTGPFSGNFWAWFGGSAGPFEEGILSQAVTIPVGTASLNFQIEQIACDNTSDFFRIAIDQDTVYATDGASSLCGQLGYTAQTVNLDVYADGASHTITMICRTYSLAGGPTNFFIDAVELIACPPIGFAEPTLTNHVELMPNPANHYFELKFNNIELNDVRVNVTDLAGKSVLSQNISKAYDQLRTRIDVSRLAKGTYLVNLRSGNNTTTKKLIIQ